MGRQATRKAKKVKEQMSTAATATTTPQSDSNNGVAIAITHMDTQNICKSKQRAELVLVNDCQIPCAGVVETRGCLPNHLSLED